MQGAGMALAWHRRGAGMALAWRWQGAGMALAARHRGRARRGTNQPTALCAKLSWGMRRGSVGRPRLNGRGSGGERLSLDEAASMAVFCTLAVASTLAQAAPGAALDSVRCKPMPSEAFAFTWANVWPIGLKVVTSPFIILGLVCYVLSVILWLLVLSRSDVVVAYPMTSIAFILTAISAYLFLGESLTPLRITGIVVIIVGIYLITR